MLAQEKTLLLLSKFSILASTALIPKFLSTTFSSSDKFINNLGSALAYNNKSLLNSLELNLECMIQ